MDKKGIITTTRANENGEMLWCVHFTSFFYDNDSRGSGNIPVDEHYFVLAKDKEEAISKLEGKINKDRRRSDKNADEKITATIATIEDLIPARDSSNDGLIGFYSTNNLSPVILTCEEDQKRYRIAVCLIPLS